jgi:hypothetical protein
MVKDPEKVAGRPNSFRQMAKTCWYDTPNERLVLVLISPI